MASFEWKLTELDLSTDYDEEEHIEREKDEILCKQEQERPEVLNQPQPLSPATLPQQLQSQQAPQPGLALDSELDELLLELIEIEGIGTEAALVSGRGGTNDASDINTVDETRTIEDSESLNSYNQPTTTSNTNTTTETSTNTTRDVSHPPTAASTIRARSDIYMLKATDKNEAPAGDSANPPEEELVKRQEEATLMEEDQTRDLVLMLFPSRKAFDDTANANEVFSFWKQIDDKEKAHTEPHGILVRRKSTARINRGAIKPSVDAPKPKDAAPQPISRPEKQHEATNTERPKPDITVSETSVSPKNSADSRDERVPNSASGRPPLPTRYDVSDHNAANFDISDRKASQTTVLSFSPRPSQIQQKLATLSTAAPFSGAPSALCCLIVSAFGVSFKQFDEDITSLVEELSVGSDRGCICGFGAPLYSEFELPQDKAMLALRENDESFTSFKHWFLGLYTNSFLT